MAQNSKSNANCVHISGRLPLICFKIGHRLGEIEKINIYDMQSIRKYRRNYGKLLKRRKTSFGIFKHKDTR